MGNQIMAFWNRNVKRSWKTAFLAAVILGFCVHMYKFTNTLPGNDSLYNFYHDQNIIGAGRWFLSLACGISSYHDLPWLIGVLSVVFLALTTVVIADHFRIEDPVMLILCAGMVTVFPSITDTLYFEFTADGYFLAMLLAALAARLTRMDVITPKRAVAGAVLVCLACGIYQAYVSAALVLAICGFLLELLEGKRTTKECWKWTLTQAGIYIAALAGYYVIWQVLMKLQNVTPVEYRGIDDLGSFGIHTLIAGVRSMIQTLVLFFFEWNFLKNGLTLYGALNLALLGVLALGLWTAAWKSGLFRRKQHLLLAVLCLIALPMSVCIWHFASAEAAYHPRMMGSICILFIFALVLADRWFKPKWSAVAGVIAAVMILNNAVQANITYYYMDRSYERSYATALEMTMRVRPLAEESGVTRVAIAGNVRNQASMDVSEEGVYFPLLARTVMDTLFYDHIHIKMYMDEIFDLGLEFVDQLEADRISRMEEVAQMGIWPAGDSIAVIGDTIVIKIDDYDPEEGLSFRPR